MNQSKIDRHSLKDFHVSANENVKIYHVDLDKIVVSREFKGEYLNLAFRIRQLLRAKSNLERSLEFLQELLVNIKEIDGKKQKTMNFYNRTQALELSAIMLYRACFVKGEKGKSPLEKIGKELSSNVVHDRLRKLGDKLYGHLDENFQDRIDETKFQLKFVGNEITIGRIDHSLSSHFFENQKNISLWIEHIIDLKETVISEIEKSEIEIKNLIGEIKII